mmetsp:Transcript_6717/g.11556  ORF Transcript_6717/g.11556 Transcript_6717/m.11556 type:complete len:507 (-) Transcript_6717:129-1649(-)
MGGVLCAEPGSSSPRIKPSMVMNPDEPGRVSRVSVMDEENAEYMKTPRYEGSYGKLKRFLKKCMENEVIGEEHYNDLVAALEDVSDHGKEKDRERTLRNPTLKGGYAEEEMCSGLQLMEIPTMKPVLKRRLSLNESSFIVDDSEEGAEQFSVLLANPTFNCLTRGSVASPADIQAVAFGFTAPYNLVGRYKMNNDHLESWLAAIANRYVSNPYHNWRHAFDVYQFMHCSLAKGGAGEYFNFQDILALLTAVIAHDVGHGGTNNAFLVNTGAKLAITYNDQSPLENMHSSVCFEMLGQPGQNWMEPLAKDVQKNARSKVIECILATDMSSHFELTDKFTARVAHSPDAPFQKNTKNDRARQQETREDRRLLMLAFTHMADLGHTSRPWDVHKNVVCLLEEEMFSQGDQERALGLPISPMMDRLKDSAATGQNFFLDKLVRPLFDPFCHFLAPGIASTFQGNLDANQAKWSELVHTFGKMSATDLIPLEERTNKAAKSTTTDGKGAKA